MSNIDKRALREAAEKATPGRIGDRVDGSIKYTCRGTDGTLVLSTDNHDDYGFVGDNSLEDELFFRLCDPVTVLALLDELEALKLANAAQDDHINQQQDRIDLLEKGNNEAARQINSWRRLAKHNIAEREKDVSELNIARKRIAELEAREVVLPQRYSMLHRVDFDEPYHTEMVYKQHQVLEALHDAGVNVAAAAKGE
ncbi:ead/Ea22-like family protein [Enterobacter hormaechei subsp. steigerwaltii]|uniref:ead/Ea22-like family protein n=1 Tax=Enterobacter hormaechei TaxID=158836 RepID=UPI002FD1AD13